MSQSEKIGASMGWSKKYISGNSILESVTSLCIVSTCLAVFAMLIGNLIDIQNKGNDVHELNKINQCFFLLNMGVDINEHKLGNNISIDYGNAENAYIIKSSKDLDSNYRTFIIEE